MSLFEQEYQTLDEAISLTERSRPWLAEVFWATSIMDPLFISRDPGLKQLFTSVISLAEAVIKADV